ncbi:MAG: DUF4157 domain-containing protein, partial [Pyrinomonadaceae bacterium]
FSHVRIHRDREATNLTDSMNAYAVTRGSEISFATDGYAPETTAGRAIIAHELAHVVQNESLAAATPQSGVESEAANAATAVVAGEKAEVSHASTQPVHAITRGEKTAAGAALGGAALGAVGMAIGLGVASQMSNRPFLNAAAIGGLIGMGVGAIAGALIGFFTRNTTPETIPEAEELIRRRFGRYMRSVRTGPLHNASVHVVSKEELCERKHCRSPEADCNLVGWTDTGVPIKPIEGPGNQPPPIQSQADEPVCNGKQMEHATPERPVIYYMRDSEHAGTLIHEGLHTYEHRDFEFLHNYVSEGTTEYFTRQIQDDINMPYNGGYNDQVAGIQPLIRLVGEDLLARAYFSGSVPELHQAVNNQLGPCALITWALNLAMGSEMRAQTVMENRNHDYCNSPEWLLGVNTPGALTPPAPSQPRGSRQMQKQTHE